MNQNNDNKEFIYTYSAKDNAEIERIRQKYRTDEQDSLHQRIYRLDASVQGRASAVAIAIGVIGSLIMGTGMSAVMVEDFGHYLGLGIYSVPVGIAVGLMGMAIAALAYPAYRAVYKHRKNKIAPLILRLADQLEAAQNKAESD